MIATRESPEIRALRLRIEMLERHVSDLAALVRAGLPKEADAPSPTRRLTAKPPQDWGKV